MSVCGCNIGSTIDNTDLQALHRAVDDRAKPDKDAQGDGDGEQHREGPGAGGLVPRMDGWEMRRRVRSRFQRPVLDALFRRYTIINAWLP